MNTKYVIRDKMYNTLLDRYWKLDKQSNKLIGYFQPEFADVFNSKKSALEFINKYFTNRKNFEIVSLATAQDERLYDNTHGTVLGERPIRSSLSRKYNNEPLEDIVDWYFQVKQLEDSQIDYEDYKTWPQLYNVSKCIWSISAFEPRKANKTYVSFGIFIKEDLEFSEFKKEFGMCLPYVTLLDENGNKQIDVTDYNLSENGIVHIFAKPNGKYSMGITRYCNTSIDEKEMTLNELFNYLKEYHLYGWK